MNHITIQLTESHAEALAVIINRITYYDAASVASRTYTADDLLAAVNALQRALRAAGYNPR